MLYRLVGKDHLLNTNQHKFMKKNRLTIKRYLRLVGSLKVIRIMKISVFLILIGVFQAFAASSYSQNERLSLDLENVTVKQVLDNIEAQSEYFFLYSSKLVDVERRVDVIVKNKLISEILKSTFDGTDVEYVVMDKQIVLSSRKNLESALQESLLSKAVKGKVVGTDGLGIPGVNVFIKGSTTGTITDIDGNYSIEVSNENAILVFSFIGYDNQEIIVGGQSEINVQLVSNVEALSEVVITALNISRDKNSLGYSITEVSNEELTQVRDNNPINSLSGKVAGLQISGTPSGVDGSSRVVLRGITSIQGNNRPLVVIDGMPVDNRSYGGTNVDGGTDMGDALSDINPDDIESMSVLKGAGAAAAYGSRGANGVILITTKKGSGRKGLGVSFNSSFIVESPYLFPDLQNSYGQGAFGQHPMEHYDNMEDIKWTDPWIWSWGRPMEGQIYEDWLGNDSPYNPQSNQIEEFYQNGSSFINTLALDAGNGETSFRASITTQNSSGIYPGNKMNKQTINLRGFSKIGKRLEFDSKFVYIHSKVENRPYLNEDPGNPVWALGIMPRNVTLASLKDNSVDQNGYEMWSFEKSVSNPYWILNNKSNEDYKHRMQSFLSLKYDISSKFDLIVRSGIDFTSRNTRSYAGAGSRNHTIRYEYQGYMAQNASHYVEWNSDFMFTYQQPIGNNFNLNLSLGGNHRYNQQKSISQRGYSWQAPNFYHMSNVGTSTTGERLVEKEVLSLYGLGTLSFKDYLYADFTYRKDASSTLPAGNMFYDFYSTNVSFLFTEALKMNSNVLSKGKIRGSVARVGNDTDPYRTANYYSMSSTNLSYPTGSLSSTLAIENFKPEITTSWEIGTELGLFRNAINVDLTYYEASTKNQILSVELAPSSAFRYQIINAGEIRNHGFEGLISASPIRSHRTLKWDLSFNVTKNINEVITLTDNYDQAYIERSVFGFAFVSMKVGESFGSLYGYDYKRNSAGQKLITDGGLPIKSDEMVKLGDINPDLNGGLANKFTYKNFSLNFLIDFQLGGDIFSQGALYRDLYGTSEASLEGRKEWYSTHDGPLFSNEIPGVIPKGYVEDGVNLNTGLKNEVPVQPLYRNFNVIYFDKIVADYVLDASNVRLRELTFGFNLPNQWLTKTSLTRANVSLVGRNLFFFYNAANDIDPESGYSAGSFGNAFEMNAMPSTRSYGVNLSLTF